MNRIEFVVKNNDDVEFVDIFIDGVNLVEILKEHESLWTYPCQVDSV
ncbi:hypothetical protein PG301_07820 [Parageobacillus sp. G301]|jgi:hypothetical protein|nr:hypothetical protein PG301_07820 [Parageobacillus sp. G301]